MILDDNVGLGILKMPAFLKQETTNCEHLAADI